MPRVHLEVPSFTYQAESRTLPRRRCRGCGQRGVITETVSKTNGGPPRRTLACSNCGPVGEKDR